MKHLYYFAIIFLGFYITRINVILTVILCSALMYFAIKRLKRAHVYAGLCIGLICLFLTQLPKHNQTNRSIDNIAIVIEAKADYYIIRTINGRFYIEATDNDFEYLDVIKIKGEILEVKMHAIESNFDFKKYLNDQGVFFELKTISVNHVYKRLIRNKQIAANMCHKLDKEACILTQNLVLARNEKSDISSYVSLLGITYLFTVSGFNLFHFKKVTSTTYKYLGIKKHRELLTYLTLLPYCLLILHRFAVVKFLVLGLLQFINKKTLNERYIFLVFCSFILFLCLDMYLIYQLKFYLPYLMSLIMMLTRRHLKKDLFSKIFQLLLTYLLISILLLEEAELNLVSFVLRIALMPGLFAVSVIAIFTSLRIIPPGVMNSLTKVISNLLEVLAKTDSTIITGKSDLILSSSLLFILIAYLFCLSIKDKKLMHNLALSLICIISIRPLGIMNYFKSAIYFIDVGQGDCILIQDKNVNVLIDTGGNKYKDIATTTLLPFFKKQRIMSLDTIIISHNDFDHNGALNGLIDGYNVNRIITSKTEFPYTIGNLEFINLSHDSYLDDNDNSLVLYLEFLNRKWLFMGDASKEVEQKVISSHPQLDVDYIKIGHHGSNTSSDKMFLKSITPSEAIISAGFLNSYGHPHQEVLNNLASLNIKIRRTDLEGTIVYQKYSN